MPQPNLLLFHVEPHTREEHDFNFHLDTIKGYWRDFCIFPAFLCLHYEYFTFLKKLSLFFLQKNNIFFEIQQVCFFRYDELVNNC